MFQMFIWRSVTAEVGFNHIHIHLCFAVPYFAVGQDFLQVLLL